MRINYMNNGSKCDKINDDGMGWGEINHDVTKEMRRDEKAVRAVISRHPPRINLCICFSIAISLKPSLQETL